MNKRVNIFLDSSDLNSLDYFPNNNPADFQIKLPERLNCSQNWQITLKSIFVSNDLYNVYEDSCWMRFFFNEQQNRRYF